MHEVIQELTRQAVRQSRPNWVIQTENAVKNLGAFLWEYKFLLLMVALFFFGWLVLRGCVPAGFGGKSKGELALESRIAQAETRMQVQINARDAEIARLSQEAAVNQARLNSLSEQGRHDIDAATPANEIPMDPALELAWRTSLERMYADAGLDPYRPDPGQPSP